MKRPHAAVIIGFIARRRRCLALLILQQGFRAPHQAEPKSISARHTFGIEAVPRAGNRGTPQVVAYPDDCDQLVIAQGRRAACRISAAISSSSAARANSTSTGALSPDRRTPLSKVRRTMPDWSVGQNQQNRRYRLDVAVSLVSVSSRNSVSCVVKLGTGCRFPGSRATLSRYSISSWIGHGSTDTHSQQFNTLAAIPICHSRLKEGFTISANAGRSDCSRSN